ncbi:MAG TPA: DNA translocase FtsK [Candidatus Dojkabacteria bacterium]|nr:DNA translocase FtsK [Candidatus Dojkabacteria bacterium]HQF36626.1 DNA translocase FtsK [Candidatus Dojkabacteria bacterium]
MAKRGRPSKKKDITIKSTETKVFFGLVFLVIGVLFIVSLFSSGEFFSVISSQIGSTAIIFGIFLILIATKLFGYDGRITSFPFLVSFLLLCVWALPLFHFPYADNGLQVAEEGRGGGLLGYELHNVLYGLFDKVGELIILLFVGIVIFSALSGISISFIGNIFIAIASKISSIFSRNQEDTEEGEFVGNDKQEETLFLDSPQTITSPIHKETMFDHTQDKEVEDVESVLSDTDDTSIQLYPDWKYPPITLLEVPPPIEDRTDIYKGKAKLIEDTLKSFNIVTQVVDFHYGPTVVQYALRVSMGTKIGKIVNLSKDLALALAAPSGSVRVLAPIPGTNYVGIEVPHDKPMTISIRELMGSDFIKNHSFDLPLVFGKAVTGEIIAQDLTKMPHLLIAGATGSGKSVTVNGFIMGLIMSMSPDQLRLILVDPKTVEFAPYSDIPHLMVPVVTDVSKVVGVLTWATEEMQNRYKRLKKVGVRNIKEYNEKMGYTEMPYIVIIIDEMADLMLTTGVDVENKVVRIAQMARAVGIHLILATQRPSVNVITGLIKANIPARIAMTVSTSIDSRVILDQVGAEELLGRGDMLYKSPEKSHPTRIQGLYCSNQEIERVVEFLKSQGEPIYQEEVFEAGGVGVVNNDESGFDFSDSVFVDSIRAVVSQQKASASYLQRKFKIGYNRAARYIDQMYELGIIGGADGSKPREVLISSADEFIQKMRGENE